MAHNLHHLARHRARSFSNLQHDGENEHARGYQNCKTGAKMRRKIGHIAPLRINPSHSGFTQWPNTRSETNSPWSTLSIFSKRILNVYETSPAIIYKHQFEIRLCNGYVLTPSEGRGNYGVFIPATPRTNVTHEIGSIESLLTKSVSSTGTKISMNS
ncbi:hypothetical protein POM88_019810 [Heracleum sosnowskyi]|uniref:Uncharacterized protein n=1 Tax=Heracleum sosnowskyi TaxID=360622 RepID=A0AAD8IDS3_9APIA|nr:hypothetical protein POM88_019810 [Heracleum sosnowskyi]